MKALLFSSFLLSLFSPGWLQPSTAGMLSQVWRGELSGSAGHHASGEVVLRDGPMGAILSLEGFKLEKVPDGRVYLARDGNYRQGLELGKLEKFSGQVSYKLPNMTDASAYNSVVIWCEKFSVEIGRASLVETMK